MMSTFGRRFFSTVEKHVPPKKLYGIPGRYAEATYVAASKAGNLDAVESELLAFKNALNKNSGFASYISNPTVRREEKVAKVAEILDESKFSHISRNLFMVLSANGRIGEATKVIDAYEDLMQTAKGIVKATVTSSDKLTKKSTESVENAIRKLAGDNKQVEISYVVDPKLLGGLQILVGDRFIDLSVASRIAELSKTLESVQ